MNEKLEVRNTLGNVIRQADSESRMVEGYALLFETSSDGLNFEEVISREALEGVIARSDVFALLNHSKERGILARSINGAGSLTLEVDEKGLLYRFDAPNTALGNELLENLRRGEINQASFAFDVDSDKWERKSDGTWKRTIKQIGHLYDVSPVYNAAYSKTSVYMRGKEVEEERLAEEERRNSIPEGYYEQMVKNFNF
jgi:HK97 family phage prohead protease